ncbi:hypothetical protein [Weissella halotolerans]|nr:hypothetical protein [Weissella halotolerans]
MKAIQEIMIDHQNKVVVHQDTHGSLFLDYYQKQLGKWELQIEKPIRLNN